MMRVCSGCGIITANRRCPDCQRTYETQRGRRTAHGRYDAKWVKLSARAKVEHPWCSVCGHPGDADNPLTGDHITPHRAGGKNVRSNVQVMCRRCNSRKGASLQSGGA